MKKINIDSKVTITFPNGEKITTNAAMLNLISIWASESASLYKKEGLNALSEEAKEKADYIYNFLDSKGLYD